MNTIRLIFIFVALLWSYGIFSQIKPRSPEVIRKEMNQIKNSTDWSDNAAAAKSQAKIEALAKELMMAGKTQQLQAAGVQQVDSAKLKEEIDYKMGLWNQMMEAVDQGENGNILLAKPLREEIVEAYKNDESPKVKNPLYYQEQTFLCIDMSVPTIQRIIEQMENFKSIKSLLITSSKGPVTVDLDDLLTRAGNYPLEQLHIINFRQFVTKIPEKIDQFPNLRMLSLFNNNIGQLPASAAKLDSLRILYIDMNPVSTVVPLVNSLIKLDSLSIAKTNISESEIAQIKTLLPNCKIIVQ